MELTLTLTLTRMTYRSKCSLVTPSLGNFFSEMSSNVCHFLPRRFARRVKLCLPMIQIALGNSWCLFKIKMLILRFEPP